MEHPIIIDKTGKPILRFTSKGHLIAKYLATPAGRAKIASMASPIRRSLNYQGIARRALTIQTLPQGALPTYDREIDVSAILPKRFPNDIIRINDKGKSYNKKNITAKIFGKRVTVPTFELFSNPTIKISEVKRRRFNVIDRSVQKARQQIMSQEDSMIFAALNKAGESKMDTEKVAKGIKVFGVVMFVVCLGLAIWSIFR